MHVVVEYLSFLGATVNAEEILCIFQSPFYMKKRYVRIPCRKRTEQSVDILIEMIQDILKKIHYGFIIIIYICVQQTLLGGHADLTDKKFHTLVTIGRFHPVVKCVFELMCLVNQY